ncbi:MAG: hypothetical protein LGB07_03765 [Sulfurovum sp.]|nr:hypothetical protein [Sulfurovum sp.]MCB4762092.1 hypothetical protein [Sulfurovum sp.]MCB4763730.1 hypothetical protein [Sulfurovum sp.]MCB4774018.1 hypothetical protein [Sulfurovum sp.]MCB4776458.1 hypothetical protein [Sulfurovum sp.]
MMRRQKTTPYPNLAWNTPRKSDDLWFDSVLGIRNDSKGVIWILDMGQREGLTPKIVGWNTHTDSLEQIYYIPKPASVETSQLNDFLIDEMHGVFIIADEDIGCGQSRFGCWQCYVVRDNDKSLDGLMKSGYENIELYKKYREQYWNFTQLGWENTRDVYSHRTQQREYFDAKYNRDGMTKPKGVMLKARKHFFVELLKLNAKLDYDIIYANEIHLIQERWL